MRRLRQNQQLPSHASEILSAKEGDVAHIIQDPSQCPCGTITETKSYRYLLLSSSRVKQAIVFLAGSLAPSLFRSLFRFYPSSSGSNSGCQISFGTYHGNEYDTNDRVGSRICLVESKFLKVQQHQVRMNDIIIPDWIWIDYHDRINVLVQAPSPSSDSSSKTTTSPQFLVFEQTKYALEGRMSLAIVGGIIEPGELPKDAAQREVQEEMKLDCSDFTFLGRYRTDVNRGMGWTNTFLASQCSPFLTRYQAKQDGAVEEEGVGKKDTERQDLKTLTLSELRDAVQAGQFLEIQWTATISLALLHLEKATV